MLESVVGSGGQMKKVFPQGERIKTCPAYRMTDKIATVPWSIPGVLSGGPGGAWGSGKSAQRKTGRPVSRSAKDTILRMSKTLEKWLPEELSRFHPCAVAEFDAFALGEPHAH